MDPSHRHRWHEGTEQAEGWQGSILDAPAARLQGAPEPTHRVPWGESFRPPCTRCAHLFGEDVGKRSKKKWGLALCFLLAYSVSEHDGAVEAWCSPFARVLPWRPPRLPGGPQLSAEEVRVFASPTAEIFSHLFALVPELDHCE